MALTAYDTQALNSAQQNAIAAYTDQWNAAKAAGDTAGMEAAHAAAEAIRNQAGYASDDSGNYASAYAPPANSSSAASILENQAKAAQNVQPGNGAYSQVANSYLPDLSQVINQFQTVMQENNAQAQANAQAQWEFNRQEAQKNRDWQEYMSNTAHQREVQDLIKAGLNPVLSAGGYGAAVTSGATASGSQANIDTSLNSVFGNYLVSLINSATAINNANISAKSAENVADIYTAMNYKIEHDFPHTNQVLGQVLQQIVDKVFGDKSADTRSGVKTSDGYYRANATDLEKK